MRSRGSCHMCHYLEDPSGDNLWRKRGGGVILGDIARDDRYQVSTFGRDV